VKIIPNLLSAARLVLAPCIFVLLWRRQYGMALALCVIAGVTDGLDGFIARRFDGSSKLGAYLDPIADKVLLSGAFLTLALAGEISKELAILVLGRDVLILLMAAAAFLFTQIRNFPPAFSGKASTAAQIAFVLVLIAHLGGFMSDFWIPILRALVVLLTIWSGVEYIGRGLRTIIMKK
jgi:cardiolipin synthase